MKKLEELGISPAPWTAENGPFASMVYENAPTQMCASVCALCGERRKADANLIAAAPELYEALREAVIESCHDCNAYARDGNRCTEANSQCFIQRWRKALEKAGGAE